MTQEQHPITPSDDHVKKWMRVGTMDIAPFHLAQSLCTQAARWGADMELEACVEWVTNTHAYDMTPGALRAARRPKPPSLKEQALRAIGAPAKIGEARVIEHREHELIRRALEALPDD